MDLKLPKLGEGADSGVVVNILVREGETVREGQSLIELESEKAVAPVPSPASGVVTKILVSVGDRLSVGQPFITVSGTVTDAPEEQPKAKPAARSKSPAKSKPAPAPEPEAEATEDAGEDQDFADDSEEAEAGVPSVPGVPPPASPSIRWVARELGIDLGKIRGSERGGRIVMSDLKAFVDRLRKQSLQPRPMAKQAGSVAPKAPAVKLVESIDFSKWGPVTKQPVSPIRRTIAARMTENWNAIPHVTQFEEVDITALMALRKKHQAAYEKTGAKLTLTPFALKAVVAAVKKHLIFNSSLDEGSNEIVQKNYFHIGLAVDTEAGLLVPVIRDVDKKSLVELSKEVNDLAARARDRKITLEEMRGGSFTISNQGGFGGGFFTPIVNKPEVAILGMGRALEKPVVRDGKVESRLMLPLGLSYDHRVIDGGAAARFITDLAAEFQSFPEALVQLG